MKLPRLARALKWIGSARRDYGEFPERVQEQFGFELFLAQTGLHPPSAKPFKGFGPGVIELIEDYNGDTYRAIYAVRLDTAVYVLHSFKKKSKQGIKTPQSDVDLIKRRLKDAEADNAAKLAEEKRR